MLSLQYKLYNQNEKANAQFMLAMDEGVAEAALLLAFNILSSFREMNLVDLTELKKSQIQKGMDLLSKFEKRGNPESWSFCGILHKRLFTANIQNKTAYIKSVSAIFGRSASMGFQPTFSTMKPLFKTDDACAKFVRLHGKRPCGGLDLEIQEILTSQE